MKPVLNPKGMRDLARHIHRDCLFVFDFDGVLSPHVAYRARAFPKPSTLVLLERLVEKAQVAVVSGRSLSDLKARLGFRPAYAAGNHGVEGISIFKAQLALARRATRRWEKQLQPALQEIQGTDLENKKVSLTVHYRFCEKPRQAKARLLAVVGKLEPTPRVVLGKKVVNLVFPQAAHKGAAVLALLKLSKKRRAIYVGDDVTDEDVFRLEDPRVFTIRVGRKRDSSAAYFLPAQRDIDTFLRALLKQLDV